MFVATSQAQIALSQKSLELCQKSKEQIELKLFPLLKEEKNLAELKKSLSKDKKDCLLKLQKELARVEQTILDYENLEKFKIGDFVRNGKPVPGQITGLVEGNLAYPQYWVRFEDSPIQIQVRPSELKPCDFPINIIIPIEKIKRDRVTQQRVSLNHETVTEYAEAMKEGDKFPPVKLAYDGENYWLYDGFHTTEAAWGIGLVEIEAEIILGTKRDAILASVEANTNHGLRRTNADKRRAVTTLLEDEEWSKWSDRFIARKCKVSNTFVSNLRKERTAHASGATPDDASSKISLSTFTVNKCTNEEKVTGDLASEITKNDSSSTNRVYKNKHGQVAEMETKSIGKDKSITYQSNNENVNTAELQPTSRTKKAENENNNHISLEVNQIVKVAFSSLEGLSDNLKRCNHCYGKITSLATLPNTYTVSVLGESSFAGRTSLRGNLEGQPLVFRASDLQPVEIINFNVSLTPEEFSIAMDLHKTRYQIENAMKKGALEI